MAKEGGVKIVDRSGPSEATLKYLRGEDGETVSLAAKNIWDAAERGLVGYIVKTVERNIEFNINARDKYHRTALHWASECNQIEAVEALLDYGCDATAVECNGRTAIHLAARGGHVEVLKLLLDSMSSDEQRAQMVNMGDMYGITPVYLASSKGDEGRGAFELLMDNGGRFNSQVMPHLHEDPAVDPVPKSEKAST